MKLPRASRPGPVGRTRVYNGSKTGQKWPIFDYFWGQNQPIFHNISNDIGTYYYLGSNRYSFNGIKAKENLQDIATIHQKILLSLVLRIWTRTRTRTRKFWTRNSSDPSPEKMTRLDALADILNLFITSKYALIMSVRNCWNRKSAEEGRL